MKSRPSAGASRDARLGDLSEFTSLEGRIYLNHAAISPPSARVKRAVNSALEAFASQGSSAFLGLIEERDALKARIARLLSAPSLSGEEIAWVPNTTSGVQAVAHAFPWRAQDSVLLFKGEFPTNIVPWFQAATRHQLEIKWASLEPLSRSDGPDWSSVEEALRGGVRLVAVSAVQFQTGLRVPLTPLADLCERYGAALFVDGIQACGAVPLPLGRIDFLASGGHKWMMGVEGAGFLYVHPQWRGRLTPQSAGWLSVTDPLDFLFAPTSTLRYDKELRADISALEGGAQSAIGYAALGAAVTALEQLGVEAIYKHAQSLLDPLEQGLLARGFTSARLNDASRRSNILSVQPPHGQGDIAEWATALQARGVTASTPDGWLRFSPHWPNHHGQIDETLHVIDEVLINAPWSHSS